MKKDMPLEGLRWSRDSGSTLCDTPQNGRSRTGWGGDLVKVSFRNKKNGWLKYELSFVFELNNK